MTTQPKSVRTIIGPLLKDKELIQEADRLLQAWKTHHGPAHKNRIRTRKRQFTFRQLHYKS